MITKMDGELTGVIVGPDGLKDALLKCPKDPCQVIKEMQEKVALVMPSLNPGLKFLDLLGVRRGVFYKVLLERLQTLLTEKLSAICLRKDHENNELKEEMSGCVKKLVSHLFPIVHVEEIQPIIFALLESLDDLPENVIDKLMEDEELYKVTPIEVKRKLWQTDKGEDKLLDEVLSGFYYYIDIKQRFLEDYSSGENVRLYDRLLLNLRAEYAEEGGNNHYCSLRSEIIMSLHDEDKQVLLKLDPCYEFAWTLDACLRERHIDQRQRTKLISILDGIKPGRELILGDLALIAEDSHIKHFLGLTFTKLLNQMASGSDTLAGPSGESAKLPRECPSLQLVLRLLNLGLSTHEMFTQEVFKEEPLQGFILVSLLPKFLQLIALSEGLGMFRKHGKALDDGSAGIPGGRDNDLFASEEAIWEVLDEIGSFIKSDQLSALLSWYVLLDVLQKRDWLVFNKLLPMFIKSANDVILKTIHLQPLISGVLEVSHGSSGIDENTWSTIWDAFLLPKMKDNIAVKKQALRLALNVAGRLSTLRLSQVSKKLRVKGDESGVNEEFKSSLKSFLEVVKERLDQQQQPVGAE